MSFIQFESGREKEKARQELREARAEILKKAEQRAKQRDERELQKKFRGDDQWMLPSLSKKIDKMSSSDSKSTKKKSKKSKKSSKKVKKEKKKKKSYSSSSSESGDSSSEEEKIAKKKKKKKRFTESESSSKSSEQSENEWIEKTDPSLTATSLPETPLQRDDWMSGMSIPTFSKADKPSNKDSDKQKQIDSYDPTKSTRELNPYWKDGGTGLPTFKKPNFDDDDNDEHRRQSYSYSRSRHESSRPKQSSWRKAEATTSSRGSRSRTPERDERRKKRKSSSSSSDRSRSPKKKTDNHSSENVLSQSTADVSDFLTDQQMNELGAKIVKAEIMGNAELAKELQAKLNKAREYRVNHKQEILSKSYERRTETQTKSSKTEREDVLLTRTNSKGVSRPLNQTNESDLWGGRAGKKVKKSKPVETHMSGERVRYFADDDKYDIKQMFEKEKFTSAADQDMEFANIAGGHKNPNDDLEDIFADKVRKKLDDGAMNRKERDRAIFEQQQMARTLDSCTKCFDSSKLEKQLIVAMGKTVYLALTWHEGLTKGHCIITTLSHTSCVTQLDEDVWTEVRDFMRAINRMFTSRKEDVIFFEMARDLHRRPHLEIHCVASKDFEMAPFFFKKAIQEGEQEWSTNKQLVDLKTGDVRRTIPKGLPYFWVTFGTDRGFAHVIEDKDRFPANFAQEIIGGLLNLDPQMWRRPRKLHNAIPKVKQFADWWKPFDITK